MSTRNVIKTTKEYNYIVSILENKIISDFEGTKFQKSRLKSKSSKFILRNGQLFLFCADGNHKKVISADNTESMIQEVQTLHAATHLGQNKTEELCDKLYLSIPRSLIRNIIKNCIKCKQAQPLKEKGVAKHITASFPFERVQVDCIDLQKYHQENDGYRWIMTIVDVYSKFSFAYALRSKSADEIVRCLTELILSEGVFAILHTDNGLEFKNSKVDELCQKYFIKRIFGRPRHPQSQGIVERFNQTLTRYLQKQMFEVERNNKRWVSILKQTLYYYNISSHESTKKAPFLLFKNRLGFRTCFVQDQDSTEELAILSLPYHQEAKVSQKRYFEVKYKNNVEEEEFFKVGDKVLAKKDFDNNTKTRRTKLESFYNGPFIVSKVLNNNFLVLQNGEVEFKISKHLCKKI